MGYIGYRYIFSKERVNNQKKRHAAFIVLGCMLCGLIFLCSFNSYAADFETETAKGKKSQNIHGQNYDTWASPVESYVYRNSDGTYNRIEYISNAIIAETYTSDYQYKSQKKIKMELGIFGGIYCTDDAYYVVEGSDNSKAASGKTEFRIIKYNKSWKKIKSADITDANTKVPFDAGSCRFAEDNGILYIRTCHEMYNDHQASVMIKVDMSDLKVVTADTDVANSAYGYVSHSFNQFVCVKDGVVYACDHGDAYERGIVVMRFDTLAEGTDFFENETAYYVPLEFKGEVGDNYTGATLGGFAVSDTHTIAVGSSIPQTGKSKSVNNIFVCTVETDRMEKAGSSVKWLTNYSQSGKRTAANPVLVEINENSFLVMWEEYVKDVFDKTYYMFLDGNGNSVSSKESFCAPLSDCQPVVCGDNVVWYVTDNSTPTFYQLPKNGADLPVAAKDTQFVRKGIKYKVTKSSKTAGKVSVIGFDKGTMNANLELSDNVLYNGYSYKVTAIAAKAFSKCTKLKGIYIPASVTSIGKQAFYGCKKLKTLQVKYTKYKAGNVGSNAFKGVAAGIEVVTPDKKVAAYKTLFRKRGMKASSKFRKESASWYY